MAGPWEKYAPAAPAVDAAPGPWTRYAPAASAAPAPADDAIATPQNKADFNALGAGVPYRDSAGVVRVKLPDGSSLPSDLTAAPPQPQGHPFGVDPAPLGFGDTVKDIGQSALSGLAKGTYELAAAPLTLKQAAESGIDWGMHKADSLRLRMLGQPGRTDDQWDALGAPGLAITNPIDSSLYGAVEAGREGLGSLLPKPQSKMGQYAETISSFLPALAAPEAFAGRLPTLGNTVRQAVLPAIGAQAGADALKGTRSEGAASIIGALLGGGVGGLVRLPESAAEGMVGRAGHAVTDAQWQQAADLMTRAQQMGVPLTTAEAVQQATNGGTNLSFLQRYVENAPQSADRMAQFMAPRSAQVQAAGGNFFDTLAPVTGTPSVWGMNLQDAAGHGLAAVQAERTAATSPFYQAANPQHVPQPDMDAILGDIRAHAAGDQTGLLGGPLAELEDSLTAQRAQPGTPATRTPVIGPNGQVIRYTTTPATPPTPAIPITNIENLDRARKYWRERIDNPQLTATPLEKEQGAAVTGYLARVNRLLEQNPDFMQGKLTHGDWSRALVDPVTAGPMGPISRTQDVLAQAEALMPKNPLIGSAAEGQDAAERLMLQDPEATRGVVRQGLETEFNKATAPRGATQDDQYGGARFASQITGNPQRQANIQAVLEAIAGPQGARGMQDLTDVLGATGWRARPNSATEFNRELTGQMKTGRWQAIAKAMTSPLESIRDAADRAQIGNRVNTLADLMIGPDGLPRAQDIAARYNPNAGRDALVRAMLQAPDAYHVAARQP